MSLVVVINCGATRLWNKYVLFLFVNIAVWLFYVIWYNDTSIYVLQRIHYINVIMSAMASQTTSFTFVYATVYSGACKGNTDLCAGNSPETGEFLAQRANNAGIWWRHHVDCHSWQFQLGTSSKTKQNFSDIVKCGKWCLLSMKYDFFKH